MRETNSWNGKFCAVASQSVPYSAENPYLNDFNNNFMHDECNNNFVCSDSYPCHPGVVPDSSVSAAVSSTDSVRTVTDDGGTSSVGDVETSVSFPINNIFCDERDRPIDDKSCDVHADELSDSDMSIEIDNDDLDGYILLNAEDSNVPVGGDSHCEKEHKCGISIAATEVVSMRDEGMVVLS